MPKQLINTIGTLVVVAILVVVGVFVAVPLLLQSQATNQQADAAAAANAMLQSDVDRLADQQEDLAAIESDLGVLESQIPATAQIASISKLVADAAAATGVGVSSFSPGEPVPFGSATDESGSVESQGAPEGAMQIPISVTAAGPTNDSVLAFIDALRAGPRLLGGLNATIQAGIDGTATTVNGFAYTLPAAKGE